MPTYFVRNDGTAANKAAATDPASAATAMSLATHNAETFVAGDEIVLSGRGGAFTSRLVPPSAGSSGSPIEYRFETGHETHLNQSASDGTIAVAVSYVHLRGLDARGSGAPLLFSGTAVGIETHDCIARDSGNQCLQHLDSCQVDHYNITAHDGSDECFSMHDSAAVRVFGGHFYGGGTTCANWVGSSTVEFHDVLMESTSGTRCVQISGGLDAKFYRCHFVENASISRAFDCVSIAAPVIFENCIFDGCSTGDFYLLLRSGRTVARVANCLFFGGTNTNSVIFNQSAGSDIRNNIFLDTNQRSLWGATGADTNCFFLAGAGQGTNKITGDPGLVDPDNDDFTLGDGSSCIGTGVDLSAVLDEPTDYDGQSRTAPWDIGPLRFVAATTGLASIQLDGVSSTSSASAKVTADSSISLEGVVASSSGSQTIRTEGIASIALAGVLASSAAKVAVSAETTILLEGVGVSASGSQAIDSAAGTASITLDGVVASAVATSIVEGNSTILLDGVTVVSTNSMGPAGSLDLSIFRDEIFS